MKDKAEGAADAARSPDTAEETAAVARISGGSWTRNERERIVDELRAAEARGRVEGERDALTREELAMVLGTLDGAEHNAIEEYPGRRVRSELDSAREKLERQEMRLRALASGNAPQAPTDSLLQVPATTQETNQQMAGTARAPDRGET